MGKWRGRFGVIDMFDPIESYPGLRLGQSVSQSVTQSQFWLLNKRENFLSVHSMK